MANDKFPRKRRGKRTAKPDTDTLAKLYLNHTSVEIAKMYGVAPATVNFWIWKCRREDAVSSKEER